MTEYEIRFSKQREARGLPAWAIMRMEAQDADGELWRGIKSYRTAEEAHAALVELKAKDGA